MRSYAPYWNNTTGQYSVIFRDTGEDTWYHEMDVTSAEQAEKVARALELDQSYD